MTEQPIPVVIYAALSKAKPKADDRHDEESIDSQVAKVQGRLTHVYEKSVNVAGVFSDTGFSGSKRDRGPELERAIATATAAAAKHGRAELWANTSARFARGTGGLQEARALGALYYDLKRVGVAIRTVADDEFVTNEMLVGFASAQASKYSRDLSESVTRAKRRQAERGEHLGGPMPIGYYLVDKQVVIDVDTAPVVRRVFELASQGVPDAAVARAINAEGHRTRKGQPFTRRLVQHMVGNAFYSARIEYDGERFDAKHEPLIDAADFDRIHARRAQRDNARPGQHTVGRPAKLHLLARLAICGCCGAPMFAVTSPYKRKDGTRARSYRCRSYHQSDGVCPVKPVDAGTIDTAVMQQLAVLVPDFDRWIAQIEDRHAAERDRLAQVVEDAERDRDQRADSVTKHERSHRRQVEAGADSKADLALEFVQEARAELEAAETRLKATSDALLSIPVDAPRDRILDFAIDLREAIAGKTAQARSVADVNRLLVETFDSFVVWPRGSQMPDGSLRAGQVAVEPVLRPELVDELIAGNPFEAWGTPPMEWMEAVWFSDHSHEYRLMNPKRPALAASQP